MSTTVSGISVLFPDGWITNSSFGDNAAIAVSKLAQRSFAEYVVPFTSVRVWDAMATMPVTTAANDDLALLTGTPGTNSLKLSTGDLKGAGPTTRKIGFEIAVPPNYDDGETFQVRVRCAMETTIADTAANVDLQAWIGNGSGGVGSDLVTSTASNCNSLTPSDKDFTIDATALDAGDRLQCVLSFFVEDGATNTAVTGAVYEISVRADTRG